jgi:cytoskeletal protein RodZ
MQEHAMEVMPKHKRPVIGAKRAILCLSLATLFAVVAAIAFAAGRRKTPSNGQASVNIASGASSVDLIFSPTVSPTDKPTTPPTDPPTISITPMPTTSHPTTAPTDKPTSVQATYFPGKLTVDQAGLLLSEGLSARVIGKD